MKVTSPPKDCEAVSNSITAYTSVTRCLRRLGSGALPDAGRPTTPSSLLVVFRRSSLPPHLPRHSVHFRLFVNCSFFARSPSRPPPLWSKSWSNPRVLVGRSFDFFFRFTCPFSGTPIFDGREAFFAERIAASTDLWSPIFLSSSISIFLLLTLRESPANFSLLGYRGHFGVWPSRD